MTIVRTGPRSKSPLVLPLALAAALAMPFASAAPGQAETSGQASTRNIAIGAAVAAAGIILYNNVQHKNAAAAQENTIVGRTRDGGTVYGDGRIVYPNGSVLYASNGNGRVCSWRGDGERCGRNVNAYHPRAWKPANDQRPQQDWNNRGNDRDSGRPHDRNLDDRNQSRQDR